jgi:hypothetical protein
MYAVGLSLDDCVKEEAYSFHWVLERSGKISNLIDDEG